MKHTVPSETDAELLMEYTDHKARSVGDVVACTNFLLENEPFLKTVKEYIEIIQNWGIYCGISKKAFYAECQHTIMEADRLLRQIRYQIASLRNLSQLIHVRLKILKAQGHKEKLTQVVIVDGSMHVLLSSFLMIYLPLLFAAMLFGMNIEELVPGTRLSLKHYVTVVVPVTVITVICIITMEYRSKRLGRADIYPDLESELQDSDAQATDDAEITPLDVNQQIAEDVEFDNNLIHAIRPPSAAHNTFEPLINRPSDIEMMPTGRESNGARGHDFMFGHPPDHWSTTPSGDDMGSGR
ncbi:hypothetical protein JR316_0007809 [Psilocybe cubensis]|uniref:Uncharacterized protein n=1 Tax=Psilocybe cubensis TaxID=181762 RepID=A0ACB8GUV9_PSICU|nr:hypothetical protein JR316_0007809 [Psilocybe cubensis]KAH9479222.1 hypothetical protein JR316_0007809 [Psilocybe cubensis]